MKKMPVGISDFSKLIKAGYYFVDKTKFLCLYTLLLLTGYLKGIRAVDGRRTMFELAILNKEIREVYEREILSKFGAGECGIALYDMLRAMTAGNAQAFEENLQDILRRTVSSHDTGKAESFYHGLMLGLALYFEKDYRLESNRESGYGRFDLALIPKKNNLPGIIMEFKSVKTQDEMVSAAQAAKQQIADKAYVTDLNSAGIQVIWTYGIAFCGKHAEVV